MILAPAIMQAESDPKTAAAKCLESVELDPESYRIGHTKVLFYFQHSYCTVPEVYPAFIYYLFVIFTMHYTPNLHKYTTTANSQ
jgi:hypothetical protein